MTCKSSARLLGICIALAAGLAMTATAHAQSFRPNVLDPSYDHDRWGTSHGGILKDFRAYRSSFDSADDDDGDGTPDAMGVPERVVYEIKRFDGPCIETHERPRPWITDEQLNDDGVMPDDRSYTTTTAFRNKHPAWFARGHLAMKLIAERLGDDAQWNSHAFYNAVPQRQSFNAGIWLDLEYWTSAWAQHFGSVWIVTGPIYVDHHAYAHLGHAGEFPVAIPEALFKIVIKEGATANRPDVLAFIYPQIGPGYSTKPYNHTRFLTTVDDIEDLTGIDFFTTVPDADEAAIESTEASAWWAADGEDFVRACNGNGD